MATAKRRVKGHAIIASRKEIIKNEPIVTQDNYSSDLNSALTWYTEHFNEKQLLKFALEYFAKLGKKAEVLAVNKASDSEIRQLAIICRLITREQYVSEKHHQFVTDTVGTLITKYKVVKEKKAVVEVKPSNVISIQERIEEKARELAGEIEGAIDDFVTSKGKATFSTKNFLLAKSVSAPIAKKIGDMYVGLLEELREAIAGDDEQLVEGYSNFTKRELKKFAEFVETIIMDCQQQVQTAKAGRAPRKRKAQSPIKIVSKMKFMKEFAELKLVSIKPETIIGATELWVYNTKYRRVQVYKAEYGALSVKGTSVLGFSVKDSVSMTLRKPEEFFKGISMGKRALNGAIKTLTTKPTKPNGRINEECILLGAF
jgi:hypothetical protein